MLFRLLVVVQCHCTALKILYATGVNHSGQGSYVVFVWEKSDDAAFLTPRDAAVKREPRDQCVYAAGSSFLFS